MNQRRGRTRLQFRPGMTHPSGNENIIVYYGASGLEPEAAVSCQDQSSEQWRINMSCSRRAGDAWELYQNTMDLITRYSPSRSPALSSDPSSESTSAGANSTERLPRPVARPRSTTLAETRGLKRPNRPQVNHTRKQTGSTTPVTRSRSIVVTGPRFHINNRWNS
ncbi:MAG: hypothetical protein J3Q66DRAFT_398848 [Benniella sp.]|nr:MAG: hypothetical protein J3Q66DRAFT_398848 [Benniella sp.]